MSIVKRLVPWSRMKKSVNKILSLNVANAINYFSGRSRKIFASLFLIFDSRLMPLFHCLGLIWRSNCMNLKQNYTQLYILAIVTISCVCGVWCNLRCTRPYHVPNIANLFGKENSFLLVERDSCFLYYRGHPYKGEICSFGPWEIYYVFQNHQGKLSLTRREDSIRSLLECLCYIANSKTKNKRV